MIDKNRLVSISDAIVAVAATIMVLQLDIPERVGWAAVQSQHQTLIAYLISFLQIFLAWHEHHDSLAGATKINHRIFLINCLWLFFITMLPLATGVIGKSPEHAPSILLYILILLAIQLTITWESHSVCKLNEIEVLDKPVIQKIRVLSITGYIIAAALAFVKPICGLIIILLVTAIELVMICLYDRKFY